MIGIGPFIPHPDTPLKDAEGGTLQMALKVMALTRLLLPDINIPATTAMETLVPEGQTKALQSGANVLMPNITLTSYRQYYELYPGKTTTGYTPDESLQNLKTKSYPSDGLSAAAQEPAAVFSGGTTADFFIQNASTGLIILLIINIYCTNYSLNQGEATCKNI